MCFSDSANVHYECGIEFASNPLSATSRATTHYLSFPPSQKYPVQRILIECETENTAKVVGVSLRAYFKFFFQCVSKCDVTYVNECNETKLRWKTIM